MCVTMRYVSINIIIPVYNEGENIRSTLAEIAKKVRTPYKIMIIYDFYEDNTIPVVKDLMKKNNNIKLVKNKYGRGALNAIKTGFESIDNGVVLVTMADLSDDIVQVDAMFQNINEGTDIVCGSRYMKGGKQIGGLWLKKLLSKAAGVSLHFITGIPTHDVTNSFKMYTKKVLDGIRIESNGGFEIGMEILVKAHFAGFKITEVPCVWKDRQKGKSRFKIIKWAPKYLRWYFYSIKKSILKGGKNSQSLK
jgi:dolichol-phosphate mannosyltransferase